MQTGKILIVDDDLVALKLYEEELKAVGHTVVMASNGESAVKMAEKEAFEVVFTDLNMGELNGVGVCKAIKAIHPKTDVVLISAYSLEIDAHEKEFFKAGDTSVSSTKHWILLS